MSVPHPRVTERKFATPSAARSFPSGHSDFVNQFSRCIDTTSWSSIWALTLTLKQVITHPNGNKEAVDIERCEKNFGQFMRRLNKSVFKNAATRHDKCLKVIAVHEKDRDSRYHSHAAIEAPARVEQSEFLELIRVAWLGTRWGYKDIHITPNANQGWLRYLSKTNGKSGLEHWGDCIDWGSFQNPIADHKTNGH